MIGESFGMRGTRSQFQKESLVLCQANSILPDRHYKLPEKWYMMVSSDQQFFSLKNKLDHVTLLQKEETNDMTTIVSPGW